MVLNMRRLYPVIICLSLSGNSAFADEQSTLSSSSKTTTSQKSNSTFSRSSSSSSTMSTAASKRDPSITKPSIKYVPKFKQRINDLGEQMKMAQTKGFISAVELGKFVERKSQLLLQEEAASKKGFPKEEVDKLETAVTQLNADLFKAMRKSDPVKPGAAESEVNDPNLIPAYPDPELQPGSGLKK